MIHIAASRYDVESTHPPSNQGSLLHHWDAFVPSSTPLLMEALSVQCSRPTVPQALPTVCFLSFVGGVGGRGTGVGRYEDRWRRSWIDATQPEPV